MIKSKNILFFFSVTRMGGAETTFIEIIENYKNKGHRCFAIAHKDNGTLNDFLTPLDVQLIVLDITNVNFFRTIFLYRKFIIQKIIEKYENLFLSVLQC